MDKKAQAQSLLASLYAIQFSLDPYGEFRDLDYILERGIEYDDVAESCKFYMNLELIRLLNEGYSEDELLEMIDEITVDGMDKLSPDKQDYVKEETRKLIRKRKEMLYYE